jgi:hypothetical protein
LWSALKEKNIDVLVLPSHTSNLLQPLDLCCNSQFKLNLAKVSFFSNKDKVKSFNFYIRAIWNAIYCALKPEYIKKGFINAFIIEKDYKIENLENSIKKFLDSMPETCPDHLKV